MEWSRLGIMAGVLVLTAHCESARHDGPPQPPPPPCADASAPFTGFTATGEAYVIDGGPRTAVVTLSSIEAVGYRLDAVRVTGGGTLFDFADKSREGAGGKTEFSIAINTDGSGDQVTFEVDLGCGAATMTKHYAFTLGLGRYFDVPES